MKAAASPVRQPCLLSSAKDFPALTPPAAPGEYVYILRCADDTLYTGWTTDLAARLATHNGTGKGSAAKYTRNRRPVTLVYWEDCKERSAALKRETAIKRLDRQAKLRLISSGAGFRIDKPR